MILSIATNPITPYVLLVCGMAACLYLFISLKRDLYASDRRSVQQKGELEEALKELREALSKQQNGLNETEEQLRTLSGAAPRPQSGMNLSVRGQALKLHRRGERPQQIAATLGISQTEVDLMLKVHQIALQRAG